MASWEIHDGKLTKTGFPMITALESYVAKWVNRQAKDEYEGDDKNERIQKVIHDAMCNNGKYDNFLDHGLRTHWQCRQFFNKYEKDIEDVLYEHAENAIGLEWICTDNGNACFSFALMFDRISQGAFEIVLCNLAHELYPDEY